MQLSFFLSMKGVRMFRNTMALTQLDPKTEMPKCGYSQSVVHPCSLKMQQFAIVRPINPQQQPLTPNKSTALLILTCNDTSWTEYYFPTTEMHTCTRGGTPNNSKPAHTHTAITYPPTYDTHTISNIKRNMLL